MSPHDVEQARIDEQPIALRTCRRCGEQVPDSDEAERLHWRRLDPVSDDDPRWSAPAYFPSDRPTTARPLDSDPVWGRLPW